MKSIFCAIFCIAAIAVNAATTNVVTNIVWESRVTYEPKAITNSVHRYIKGDNIVYSNVLDSVIQTWTPEGMVLSTNWHKIAISGSVTQTVYDVKFIEKPRHTFVPVTNVYKRIKFN